MRIAADLLPKEATLDVNVDILHDVFNVLEACKTMNSVLGVDPQHGIRWLKRPAPMIENE